MRSMVPLSWSGWAPAFDQCLLATVAELLSLGEDSHHVRGHGRASRNIPEKETSESKEPTRDARALLHVRCIARVAAHVSARVSARGASGEIFRPTLCGVCVGALAAENI